MEKNSENYIQISQQQQPQLQKPQKLDKVKVSEMFK